MIYHSIAKLPAYFGLIGIGFAVGTISAGVVTFTPLAPLEIGFASEARGISADGRTVVGIGHAAFDSPRALRWTDGGPAVVLPPSDDAGFGYALGVSGDGTVTVGRTANGVVRWVGDMPPEYLGGLISAGSSGGYAFAASFDGSVVVGNAPTVGQYNRAFGWSASSGMVALGALSGAAETTARGLSREGARAVGIASYPEGSRAVLWNVDGTATFLPTLLGGNESAALAFSPDGSVIVGSSNHVGRPPATAVRWINETTIEALGSLHACTFSTATAAANLGGVIVGDSTKPTGGTEAWVWTPTGGMVSLERLASGVLPPGWTLEHASGVSDDGRMIAGTGRNPAGVEQGFILTLDGSPLCRADFNADGFVSGDDFDLFVSLFEQGDPATDINRDCFVSGDDFDVFVAVFEAGC